MGATIDPGRRTWTTLLDWVPPVVVVGTWLGMLTILQVALFPRAPRLSAPVDLGLPLVLAVLAVGIRLLAPGVVSQHLAIGGVVALVAVLSAQVAIPLANATDTYCGDFCRTAIIGRGAVFVGWPVATAGVLAIVARLERRRGQPRLAGIAVAWAGTTLVLGLVAAWAWWQAILPNG